MIYVNHAKYHKKNKIYAERVYCNTVSAKKKDSLRTEDFMIKR